MREFYIEDKDKKYFINGVLPHDDIDCDPYDYFIYLVAEARANTNIQAAKHKGEFIGFEETMIRDVTLQKVKDIYNNILANTKPNEKLQQLLEKSQLKKSEQLKILRDIKITGSDILWFNKKAQELDYKLDVYQIETTPKVYENMQKPKVYAELNDGRIEQIGETNMSNGQLKAVLDQRTVIQTRIYHKDDIWHCFYFTYKGLDGKESGKLGSQSHYHYLSDKFGITKDCLLDCIRKNEMPSGVHILLDRTSATDNNP
jgi:hypothetical protein